MRRIDVTQIIDPTVEMPLTSGMLQFLQLSTLQNDRSDYVANALKWNQSTSAGLVISGVEGTIGSTITNGIISIGNANLNYTFPVIGANTAGWLNPPMLVPTKNYATGPATGFEVVADPVEFSDASTKSVCETWTLVLTDTASTTPVGGFTPFLFSTIASPNYRFYNQSVQTTTSTSNWGGTITYGMFGGIVRLKGVINHSGSPLSIPTVLDFTALKSRYRPLVAKTFSITCLDDTTYVAGTLLVNTTGVMTLNATFTGTSTQIVYLDGISFPIFDYGSNW